MLCGCSKINSEQQSHDIDSKEQSLNIKITYFSADWPYYHTVETLTEAASDIFEGKITNISFDTVNIRTGKSEKQSSDKSSLRLYTVYKIEVSDFYKGNKKEIMYIGVMSGKKGYKEAEQYEVMKNSGILNEGVGILVLNENVPLEIGESYLFLTGNLGGTYNEIINIDQFAFPINKTETSDEFNYNKIVEYIQNEKKPS